MMLAAALLAAVPPAGAEVPRRVVSMNLCTDQLAMLVAAPGQLVSVTYMAHDPRSSAMVAEAAAFPVNHGLAEEIFLLDADLVLAGRYTTRATVAMLERLGHRIEVFDPENSMEGVRANLLRMGQVLGREDVAEALVAAFDADLAALRAEIGDRPRAALYYANGYTSGDRTLAGHILAAAGFDNVAMEAGLEVSGILPLERLVMAQPDIVISGRRYRGASRAEELLDHPALRALTAGLPVSVLSDRDWVCGTPHVLRAVAGLVEARRAMEAVQ